MAVSSVYTSASVRITPVPISLLRFPPEPLPSTLPPPSGEPTLAHPFAIPPKIYNAPLSAEVPITIALIYAMIVTIMSYYNARRDHKPWAVSQTRAFRAFVIAHNVFLALFSAWTFIGLLNAVRVSFDGATEKHGIVGVVDALCKINGPRGLGDAATFNTSAGTWGFTNRALKLAADHMPDRTDIGRIWNEGLAFYGWLFYLSTFYETVDTLIILAKGNQGSFFQTYYHIGAMVCMWAGLRYMAPPIWMFVLGNSLVHALMHTYYTATALGAKVPNSIHQAITAMRIAQCVLGVTFASAHLFIAYTIPARIPYIYSLADLTSGVASDISSAASVATASASAGLGSWLKKVAFRAAGEEGLAENVRNEQGKPFGIDAIHAARDLKAREEIRYRDELRMIHCTDTSGQVFAILINSLYLAPLAGLFVRSFIRSYTRKGEDRNGRSSKGHSIMESGKHAAKDVKRELDEALDEQPGNMQDQSGDKATSGKEERAITSGHENEEQGRADAKDQGSGTSSKPGSGEDQSGRKSTQPGSSENQNKKESSKSGSGKDSTKSGSGKESTKSGSDKDHGGEESSKPGSSDNDGAKAADGDRDIEDEDEEKDDVEILDSAEAVTDVLDEGIDTADKFSKNLENSKAG